MRRLYRMQLKVQTVGSFVRYVLYSKFYDLQFKRESHIEFSTQIKPIRNKSLFNFYSFFLNYIHTINFLISYQNKQ